MHWEGRRAGVDVREMQRDLEERKSMVLRVGVDRTMRLYLIVSHLGIIVLVIGGIIRPVHMFSLKECAVVLFLRRLCSVRASYDIWVDLIRNPGEIGIFLLLTLGLPGPSK